MKTMNTDFNETAFEKIKSFELQDFLEQNGFDSEGVDEDINLVFNDGELILRFVCYLLRIMADSFALGEECYDA